MKVISIKILRIFAFIPILNMFSGFLFLYNCSKSKRKIKNIFLFIIGGLAVGLVSIGLFAGINHLAGIDIWNGRGWVRIVLFAESYVCFMFWGLFLAQFQKKRMPELFEHQEVTGDDKTKKPILVITVIIAVMIAAALIVHFAVRSTMIESIKTEIYMSEDSFLMLDYSEDNRVVYRIKDKDCETVSGWGEYDPAASVITLDLKYEGNASDTVYSLKVFDDRTELEKDGESIVVFDYCGDVVSSADFFSDKFVKNAFN